MSLFFTVIGSGSQGNSLLLEFGRNRILLDAGLSWRRIKTVLQAHNLHPDDLTCILLTHDHGDHTRGLPTLLKHHCLPVYGTSGTLLALERRGLSLPWAIPIASAQPFDLNGVTCHPFPVPHDAAEPVGYRFTWRERVLGVATDLGHISAEVLAALSDTHALCIESNYDETMLTTCRYPDWLKNRIRSNLGHMPNSGLRHLLSRLRRPLEHLVLIHLSQESNTPEHVRQAITPLCNLPAMRNAKITVATQEQPSERLCLTRPRTGTKANDSARSPNQAQQRTVRAMRAVRTARETLAVQGCFEFIDEHENIA